MTQDVAQPHRPDRAVRAAILVVVVVMAGFLTAPMARTRAATQAVVTSPSLIFTGPPRIPVSGADGEQWTVSDAINGKEVATGAVSGGIVALNLTRYGQYRLTVGRTHANFLIIGRTPDRNPFYGVSTHFSSPNPVWKTTALSDLTKIGVGSVRDESAWSATELTPGNLSLPSKVASFYAELKQVGMDNLLLASYGNTLYMDSLKAPPSTPAQQDAFARYVLFVLKNNPTAHRVELWNEFNGSYNIGCRTGTCYAQDFGPVAAKIKQARPDVTIVGGASALAPTDWFRDFYAAGGLSWSDEISYHPYHTDVTNYLSTAQTLINMQRFYLPAGALPRRLTISEVGWSITPPSGGGNHAKALDEKVQAERLIYAYLTHREIPEVSSVYWYDGINDGLDPANTESNFGLFFASNPSGDTVTAIQPKVAALALWTLRNQLDGWAPQGITRIAGGMVWKLSFTRGDQTKIVYWSDSITDYSVTAASNPIQIPLTDLVGRDATVLSATDAYASPVTVSSTVAATTKPVYLTVDKTPLPSPTYEVRGSIGTTWAQLGSERSILGYPTSNEIGGLRDGGKYQKFQHGTIYWSPTTGAYEVRGSIGTTWAQLGSERSILGYPTSNEIGGLRDGGKYQKFQHGTIYWSPTTGAYEVRGSIGTTWAQLGSERSILGYPTSNEISDPIRPREVVQSFQSGQIHWRFWNNGVYMTQ